MRTPNAMSILRTTEPCRCCEHRMRRHFVQTPPVLTAKATPHSSHSVLKIDFWKIGTGLVVGGRVEIYEASSHATTSPSRIVPPCRT